MLSILSIIIGIVFVLLLFSMLSSTVLELIDSLFSLRGRHLLNTLEHMLGSQMQAFLDHPIYKQLAYASNNRGALSRNRLPGWIDKGTFSAIVMDILKVKDSNELQQKIQSMDNGDIKRLLQFLLDQSGQDIELFKQKMELWFDEIMKRATEWYKQNTKLWLFLIGFVLAVAFNADTVQIYKSLSLNTAARDNLVLQAEQFASTHDSVTTVKIGGNDFQLKKAEFDTLRNTYQSVVQSPLGLGWTNQQGGNSIPWWLIKIAGLLLTGLAVTLGAPFWFDLLKKLLSLKGGSTTSPAPADTNSTNDTSTGNQPVAKSDKSPETPVAPPIARTRKGGAAG